MKIEIDDKGNFVITPDNWKEEQVYKLYVKALWDGETAIRLNTWYGTVVYELDVNGMHSIRETKGESDEERGK